MLRSPSRNDGHAGQLYPEEVSAYVVAQLLAAAELQLDADVSKAVISVPAYFSEAQRDATITAGRIAGLDTVKLIRWGVSVGISEALSSASRTQTMCSVFYHCPATIAVPNPVTTDPLRLHTTFSGADLQQHRARSSPAQPRGRRREPVAAALAYGLGVADDETVLVLDLGGGTFDVSILELGGGTVEVLATGGDPRLGEDPTRVESRDSGHRS